MERKINLFTIMIFAYSIIVCKVCKKDEPSSEMFSSNQVTNFQNKTISKAATNSQLPITSEFPVIAANSNSIYYRNNQ